MSILQQICQKIQHLFRIGCPMQCKSGLPTAVASLYNYFHNVFIYPLFSITNQLNCAKCTETPQRLMMFIN